MNKKNLVVIGHPDLSNSITNKIIYEELLKNKKLKIDFINLAKVYADWTIDVKKEQERLVQYENIFFMFPFYWYSCPAILKKYIDDVFNYGFAYGSTGDKLKDKNLFLIITIGGPKESYSLAGYNSLNVNEYLHAFEQTAKLAQMNYNEPLVIHKCFYHDVLLATNINAKKDVINNARTFVKSILKFF